MTAIVKPISYKKVLTAGSNNITPTGEESIVFSAIAIQNNTGEDIFYGGVDAQEFKIPTGGEFQSSGIDHGNSGAHSFSRTDDCYIRSEAGGEIVVLTSVSTREEV